MNRRSKRSEEPVLLRDAIDAVGQSIGMPTTDAFTTLAAAWDSVVGEQFVGHVFVRSLHNGVCTVEVDGAGWATQLRYAEHQVVERADACCGPGVVTALRVVRKGPGTADS
jgi:predicted nucleic acid-binding Zn ribbon protein